jgi:PAS domain S-box-containing protein
MDASRMKTDFEKLLLQQIPDALIASTPDGKVLHWNIGAERVFGYTTADALGQLLSDLIVPADQMEDERRILDETLATDLVTYESLRQRKDGTLIYVDSSCRTIRDSKGDVEFVLLNKKDVTELRALRDAKLIEARFRDLLESTPDAIVMVNVTGRMVSVNEQAERLFGYERRMLLGKPVEMLLPRRFRESHLGHRSNYFANPRKRAMGAGAELFGVRRDGSEFPVEISLSPLETEGQTFVTSAIRDSTDRKQFEHMLQEKNVELERANLAKDRFLATMSHELRTPLNAVIGFTGTLLMKLPGPLNADQEKQLRTIQSSAKHLLSLINDLLDLAKIESGKVELHKEPVNCHLVLQEVATSLRPLAEGKGLVFEVKTPDDDHVVQTDRRALTQILLNLSNNAIKFTESGKVFIELRLVDVEGRPWTTFRVTDTGIGIRADDQKKLFNAFERINPGGGRRQEGTGLGLHLSERLANLLGGRIALESEPGKGSTFTLMLNGK